MTETLDRDVTTKHRDNEGLLAELYRSALRSPPWDGFLEHLSRLIGADASSLLIDQGARDRPSLVFVHGGVEPGLSRYKKEAFALDPFVDLPPDVVLGFDEYVRTDQQTSQFVDEFLTGLGIRFLIGADIHLDDGIHVRLRMLRKDHREDFTISDRTVVAELLPHLASAVSHFIRLLDVEAERDLYGDVLDRLSIAAILVSQDGRVIERNGVVDELLKGIGLLIGPDGLLKLHTPGATKELREQIRVNANVSGLEAPPLKVFHLPRDDGEDLNLFVRPVPMPKRVELPVRSTAVVIISDPRRSSMFPGSSLRALFGLTAAEARLAKILAQGLDLREASEQLGVSHNTARSQLRSILAKTGARRQSELIGLLSRSAAELT